jgi:signal transduction histidine kinase
MASKNSRRLAHLIDDLFDLQKIEAGEMSFKLKCVDIGALVREAIQSHQGLVPRSTRSRSVTICLGRPLWWTADESRLMQVLSNMISNAASFRRMADEVVVGARIVERHGQDVRRRTTARASRPGAREKVFGRFSNSIPRISGAPAEPGSA